MAPRRIEVIGLLGTQLDGKGPKRWQGWRPTVSLFQREDVLIDALHLLHDRAHTSLAELVEEDIAGLSPETEVTHHVVELADPWDFEEVFAALHDFAVAFPFEADVDYWVHITTGTHVAQICLFLLTEARYLPGRLLQSGPPRRRGDPPSVNLIDLDLARYDRLAARFERDHRDAQGFLKSGIATENAAFNALIDRIERVAVASRAPILLGGPTGAGKSQLARRIYALKKARRVVAGPLVEVNCATLRGDQAMSTLFGHVRGAFTGATTDRAGLLRQADGGVLFLDEIGELGVDEQATLLHAIEEGRFFPVGSDHEVDSRFQLIAGSNRDLRAAVAEGRFREDLLARIDLWTFRLPGLAERPEDIAPNLDYELDRFARDHGRRPRFNRQARERFLAAATGPRARWRGNFRDLRAAVTRMATLAGARRIDEALVDEELGRLLAAWGEGQAPSDDLAARALGAEAADALDRFDRVQLDDVLAVCLASRSLSEAGRTLFQASRERKRSRNDADRLRKYLARFELTWQQLQDLPPR